MHAACCSCQFCQTQFAFYQLPTDIVCHKYPSVLLQSHLLVPQGDDSQQKTVYPFHVCLWYDQDADSMDDGVTNASCLAVYQSYMVLITNLHVKLILSEPNALIDALPCC